MPNKHHIQQAKGLIATNYAESEFNVNTLANMLGISRGYLAKVFKGCCGSSPSRCIIRYRIQKSKELLRDDPQFSILDVAFSVGFGSSQHFSATFKQEVGISPTEFRRRLHI